MRSIFYILIQTWGYSNTVWRGAYDGTHTWVRPYSGKFRTAVGETCGLPLRKVTAIPYGGRRINGQSGTPVPTVRLRIADSRGVWREALDGRPHRVAPTDGNIISQQPRCYPTLLEPCMSASHTLYFSFIFVAEQQK